MQSEISVRKNTKSHHRRTVSLITRFPQRLLDFPQSPFGRSTPVSSLETEVAHGAFTPTSSAFPCLTSLITGSALFSAGYERHSMFEWPDMLSETGNSDTSSAPSLLGSPLVPTIESVPGITRSYSDDSHSSWPPSPLLNDDSLRVKPTEMNPILLELEKKSKLCNPVTGCATCGKPGSDYPRCGKCGEMWCSRPCRLRGGKKHFCTLKP